ncbi:MAG: hypothetical protein WBK54_04455 [Bacilli bacterium]|jgi:hypothetical protein|nr:hypothetical protein [Acholeplasmataceae bacterium]
MMDKVKFIFIFSLGLFCFIYNLVRFGLPSLPEDVLRVFLQGQLGGGADSSFIGTVFDCLLRFACNVDINDLKTYFKSFGV